MEINEEDFKTLCEIESNANDIEARDITLLMLDFLSQRYSYSTDEKEIAYKHKIDECRKIIKEDYI